MPVQCLFGLPSCLSTHPQNKSHGNGQAWYGACGRGDYCGSSYGKNVGAIETYFDGMTTMICFFKVPTYTYSDKDTLILSSDIIEKSIIS